MLEGLSYTDWLLITVLWFQIANLLVQLWPKLMRLKHHNMVESRIEEKRAEPLDAYAEWLKSHGEEKHE